MGYQSPGRRVDIDDKSFLLNIGFSMMRDTIDFTMEGDEKQ